MNFKIIIQSKTEEKSKSKRKRLDPTKMNIILSSRIELFFKFIIYKH